MWWNASHLAKALIPVWLWWLKDIFKGSSSTLRQCDTMLVFFWAREWRTAFHHLLSHFGFPFFFLLKINTNYHVWQMCMCDLSTLYILKDDGDLMSVQVVFPCPFHILPACISTFSLIIFSQCTLPISCRAHSHNSATKQIIGSV